MKAFLIICGILIQSMLFACGGISQQVYSGKIEYSLDTANPLICAATITLDFDVNELLSNDSIVVNWGDGIVSAIYAVSIVEDTTASANMGSMHIYTHIYSGTHTFALLPSGGYYFISFQNEYRINGVSNITNGDGINLPFYLSAQVSIDTSATAQYLPLSFPPLTIGFSGLNTYTQKGQQQYSDNADSIVNVFTPPLEAVGNPVPLYQYPNQYCLGNGSATNTFIIDTVTGAVLWNSPCLQGIYGYCTTLSRYRNGLLLSSVMREQNIYVSANSDAGIQTIAARNIELYPNPTQGKLDVKLNTYLSYKTLDVTDIYGRTMIRNIEIVGDKFEVDVSKLSSGIYFVKLYGDEIMMQKFEKR